jgi:hypothetical protein
MSAISRSERGDLLQIARLRIKVAKAAAAQRSAELLAEFERHLAAEYSFDQDDTWREAMRRAKEAVAEASKVVAARCAELGIPARFAPDLCCNWYLRGENGSKSRRAELRKVATTRIAASERAAIAEIERQGAEIQTQLISVGMSEEAQRLLEALPSVEALMPSLPVSEVEAALEDGRQTR